MILYLLSPIWFWENHTLSRYSYRWYQLFGCTFQFSLSLLTFYIFVLYILYIYICAYIIYIFCIFYIVKFFYCSKNDQLFGVFQSIIFLSFFSSLYAPILPRLVREKYKRVLQKRVDRFRYKSKTIRRSYWYLEVHVKDKLFWRSRIGYSLRNELIAHNSFS